MQLHSIFLFFLFCAPILAARGGQKDVPKLIYWGHYMPMVPHGHMHAHPHSAGNHDAWPFDSQHPSAKDDYKEDIRQALDSGINGFQMLAFVNEAAFEAAREIYAETREMFYIAPLWVYPKDFDKSISTIEQFVRAHPDDPHVYTIGKRQVHFFWESIDGALLGKIHAALLARGIDIVAVPTLHGLDHSLLSEKSLPATPWLAAQGWSHAAPDVSVAASIMERVRRLAPKDFFYIPAIAAGYDSSNRTGQAIHVPFRGIASLRDNLKTWTELGCRQLVLVTWNDPQETLEIPSSRNLWGHNALMRYYREIAATGRSPFAAPQTIVSYPVECIQGDDLLFQVLGLPSADANLAWRARVALQPILPGTGTDRDPHPPFSLTMELPAPGTNKDAFLHQTWNTRPALAIGAAALQPRITVEYRPADAAKDAPWQTLHQDLLMPPVTLRYNLVQYPVPYAIQLSRLDATGSLSLDISPSPAVPGLSKAIVETSASFPIRRLILNDGTRSLGVFRDAASSAHPLRNLHVRIEASAEQPLSLRIDKGMLHELYSPYGNLDKAIQPLDAPTAVFSSRPAGDEYKMRVVRISAAPDATLTLCYARHPETTALTATLGQLARGSVVRAFSDQEGTATLGMALTSDATDPNIDFPLPSHGTVSRELPLHLAREGERVLHAMALLANDTVAVSPAVVAGDPAPDALQSVSTQWIQTGGSFDDFVLGSSSDSLNPFGPAQVRVSELRRRAVPYFHLGFEEGAGIRLNDTGVSQQAGRAWIEIGQAKRDDAASGSLHEGRYRWLPDGEGGKGGALRLGPDASIRFRSKSSPVGPQTLALWVDIAMPDAASANLSRPVSGKTEASLAASVLEAGPFTLEILGADAHSGAAANSVRLAFDRSGVRRNSVLPAAGLAPGLNHLAFVYDLGAVSLYINGRLAHTIPDVRPLYQRSHQAPAIRFLRPDLPKTPSIYFTGKLDEVEVIGAALAPDDIASLAAGRPWRALTD